MGLAFTIHNHKGNNTFLRVFVIILLSCIPGTTNLSSNQSLTKISVSPHSDPCGTRSMLDTLKIEGHLSFDKILNAASDFGKQYHLSPLAALYPRSVSDISTTVKHIFNTGSTSNLTVAARGHGHSLQGQAQAHQGVVINMESLQSHGMKVYKGKNPHVDVSGGELWINVLQETLKHGLAPKSWTDYLHLTIGGTLSNAGISGQTFRHGPQISNVYWLEVVTGRGEVMTCSEEQNADLFHGVLGGLGQFGIITRARISLEPARKMVKWIRVIYSDFSMFSRDQELLISMANTFDYVEGFVIINRTRLLNNWRSSFDPNNSIEASKFSSEGKTLFCLEVAKYFNPEEADSMNQQTERLLSELSYIPSTLFSSKLPYLEFLNRVHISEIKLRERGLWEVPHPWLNLFIPKSKVFKFVEEVFGNIVTSNPNGPILIYPVNQTKWNNKTSLVTPDEEIIYVASFLSSAVPSSKETDGLDYLRKRNQRILDFCVKAQLNVKQYLPHYQTQEEWKAHFGHRWGTFVHRKSAYDPLAILAPWTQNLPKSNTVPSNLSILYAMWNKQSIELYQHIQVSIP